MAGGYWLGTARGRGDSIISKCAVTGKRSMGTRGRKGGGTLLHILN